MRKDYLGKRVVSVVTRDVSDDCNSEVVMGIKFSQKMARKGKGGHFVLFQLNNVELDIGASSTWLDEGFKAGLFGTISYRYPMQKLKFTEVQFEYKSISDPYTGN